MKITILKDVRKKILKLDKPIQKRIIEKIDNVSRLQNPRTQGEALVGNLAGLWKYRVKNYRIVCRIKDKILEILVVKIAHRSEVYK